MNESGTGPAQDNGRKRDAADGRRLVYVHTDAGLDDRANEISLGELWGMVWAGKWIIIATTTLFGALAVAYALSATEWFRADVLLAPVEEDAAPAMLGQLGGLAGLAGVNVGGGGSAEPLAVLQSREFARDFIEDGDLLPVFFADQWSPDKKSWIDTDPDSQPDIRDAVKLFHETILRVTEVGADGLISMSIEWPDPELAASWASALVERLNRRMRERSLAEAEANVRYLESELGRTSILAIQQSIGRLLESEYQKVMMAKGRQEFSFRVIDPAVVPKRRSRPRRALIAVLGVMLGGLIGVFAALVTGMRRSQRTAQGLGD